MNHSGFPLSLTCACLLDRPVTSSVSQFQPGNHLGGPLRTAAGNVKGAARRRSSSLDGPPADRDGREMTTQKSAQQCQGYRGIGGATVTLARMSFPFRRLVNSGR
jgi:hypothetical protein